MPVQLPLDIRLRDSATFSSFLVTKNEQVVAALEQFAIGCGDEFLYIAGAAGAGKTHLLNAVCHTAREQGMSTVYLPLQRHAELSPAMLQGWDSMQMVCIDDVHCIVGMPDWEEALFHLFNQLREQGVFLLITGEQKPQALSCQLADLCSRLSWGVVFGLQLPDDEMKQRIMQQTASQRGLELPDEVARYLLRHCSRELTDLVRLLDELDSHSLAQQRRLTIPFVSDFLSQQPASR